MGLVFLFLPALILASSCDLLAGQAFMKAAAETNVNQRYTIESVSFSGVPVEKAKLPSRLRQRLDALVGAHYDMGLIEDLATELKRELHLRSIDQHLSKGSQPDRIRVNFDAVKKEFGFDLSVPKFLFYSKQGATGEVDASTHVGRNTVTVGAVSNGDDLTERFTGIIARYEDERFFIDKLRFGVGFEDFHEQWTDSTRKALAATREPVGFELYSTRRNIAPQLTLAPVKSLTVSAGFSFEQMRPENPVSGLLSANAVTAEIHYGRKIEGDSFQQTMDGKYNLRLGLRGLGSDYSYTRHLISAHYELKAGRQCVSDDFQAGSITCEAPFFERFVLGSSSTLRGWDRYMIDPLGGSRVVHNSVAYGYQIGEGTAELFYDTGALWHSGRAAQLRHPLGVGYRQGVFVLTMAFPVVDGRVTPVFMAGMNY